MFMDFANAGAIVHAARALKRAARRVMQIGGRALVDRGAPRGRGLSLDFRTFVRCSIFGLELFGLGGRSGILLRARRSRAASP